MGCCGKKTQDDDEVQKCGMTPSADRKCRDVICCILFIVYWVGMVIIAIVGLSQGTPEKLIYGTDFEGNVCGSGDRTNETLLYYPRLNEDMLYAMTNSIPLTEMNYYGICVNTCPVTGTSVCGYAEPNCWTAALDTENVFFRCLPVAAKNETLLESSCVDPVGADPTCTVLRKFTGSCDTVCKVRQDKTEVLDTAEATSNPVLEQMQGAAQLLGRLTGDVENAAPLVLLAGGVGALFLGAVWLLVLKYFAACMVWLTCFLVVLSMTFLSLYASVKADLISPSDVPGMPESITLSEELQAAHEDETSQFKAVAYISWTITGILLLLIAAMKKRISIAIAIIKEASRCIQRMPFLVLWPIVPAVAILAMVMYWMAIAAFIVSSNDISITDLTAAVNDAAGTSIVTSNTTDLSVNATVTGLGQLPSTSTQDVLFIYHFFGFLWTNQLIQAISICTIGGAVSQYYWTLPDQFGDRDVGRFPIASSLKRVFRFHLGSLAFGALIIALVQLARTILEYIDQNTKGVQDSNAMVKVVMKIIKCVLWCFEKCLKFLSKNAYIIISMKGSSFCSAARQAFVLILANIARVATINTISTFLLLLVKVTISAAAGAVVFVTTSNDAIYQAGGSKELSSPLAPVLVACLVAWFISSSFMNVYDMAIDTILICFCEDTKLNDQGASDYMSPELSKIMGGGSGSSNNHAAGGKDEPTRKVSVKPRGSAI